jgi:sugar (pentulose or hexulose) kinase
MPVATLATSEGGIVGAAICALVGAGCYAGVAEAADRIVVESGPRYEPGADVGAYGRAYDRFRAFHDALVPLWKAYA